MASKIEVRESDSELATWAKELAKAVRPDELARLVKDYREIARNPRRSADDREFAKRRADALSEFL